MNNIVTKHAQQRIIRRSEFNDSNMNLLNTYAYFRGYKPSEFTGDFGKYVKSKVRDEKTSIKIYRGYVFVYYNTKLITLYKIPKKYYNDYLTQMSKKNHKQTIYKTNIKSIIRRMKHDKEIKKDQYDQLIEMAEKADEVDNIIIDNFILSFDKIRILRNFVNKLKEHYKYSPTVRKTIDKVYNESVDSMKEYEKLLGEE